MIAKHGHGQRKYDKTAGEMWRGLDAVLVPFFIDECFDVG